MTRSGVVAAIALGLAGLLPASMALAQQGGPCTGAGPRCRAAQHAQRTTRVAAHPQQPDDEQGPDDALGQFGGDIDESKIARVIHALPPAAVGQASGDLPNRVLLSNLPAVTKQGTAKHAGSPGSCEAQSFGYGLGSYTAARAPDGHVLWDASRPENEASAAFLYAWQHKQDGKQCPKGTPAMGYLDRLIAIGAPSASEVPYEPKCPYLNGGSYLDKSYADEARFRLGSYASIPITPQALPLLKAMLASGHAVAFTGRVLKGYANPQIEDGVLYQTEVLPKSGHGQLLVGYDDTRGKPGQQGAFLVQNSFGTDWPAAAPGGRIWISYASWLASQKAAAVAYPVDAWGTHGERLDASAGAPAAELIRAKQWSDGKSDYLILFHRFAEPVKVLTVTLRTPAGRGARETINHYMQSGYTYLQRHDGRAFASGRWQVSIDAETVAGQHIQYHGMAVVPRADGRRPGPVDRKVEGPTGTPVQMM